MVLKRSSAIFAYQHDHQLFFIFLNSYTDKQHTHMHTHAHTHARMRTRKQAYNLQTHIFTHTETHTNILKHAYTLHKSYAYILGYINLT